MPTVKVPGEQVHVAQEGTSGRMQDKFQDGNGLNNGKDEDGYFGKADWKKRKRECNGTVY